MSTDTNKRHMFHLLYPVVQEIHDAHDLQKVYILAERRVLSVWIHLCVYVCKPPEPKHTFGPREKKKTLTFSAQTHGFSIFPEVFETFLRFST